MFKNNRRRVDLGAGSQREQLLVRHVRQDQRVRDKRAGMKGETHRGEVAQHVIGSDVQLVLQTQKTTQSESGVQGRSLRPSPEAEASGWAPSAAPTRHIPAEFSNKLGGPSRRFDGGPGFRFNAFRSATSNHPQRNLGESSAGRQFHSETTKTSSRSITRSQDQGSRCSYVGLYLTNATWRIPPVQECSSLK